ncbi:hypothetical protein JCM10213_005866 [Rhodosporidiobolus nylandii]
MSVLSSPLLDPPQWTAALAPFLRSTLGFDALPEVVHLTVYACAASFAVQALSRVVSPRLFGRFYTSLRRTKQDDWDLHMVGWLFSIVATPLAFFVLRWPSAELVQEPIRGIATSEARLAAMGTGYFLWDALSTLRHFRTQGLGFALHGCGCFCAAIFTFKPFLLGNVGRFLIWEFSTIFLNAHWLLDKLNLTGSRLQLINGLFLISAFVGARLLYGTYSSFLVWRLLLPSAGDSSKAAIAARETPHWIRVLYLGLNLLMNGLNFYWFRLMVLALRKRFVASPSPASAEAKKAVPDNVQNGQLGEAAEKRAKRE